MPTRFWRTAPNEECVSNISSGFKLTISQEYDLHGVWPPPEPEDDYIPNRPRSHSHYHGYSSRNNAFQGPFYGQPSPFSSFGFSDPFALFDSIFGDSFFGDPGSHRQPSHYRHPHRSASSWPEDPFEHVHRMHADISMNMRRMEQGMLFGMGGGLLGGRSSVPTLESSSSFDNGRTRWASESYMTSAVNGVSQTIHKRRDWDASLLSLRLPHCIDFILGKRTCHSHICRRSRGPHHEWRGATTWLCGPTTTWRTTKIFTTGWHPIPTASSYRTERNDIKIRLSYASTTTTISRKSLCKS